MSFLPTNLFVVLIALAAWRCSVFGDKIVGGVETTIEKHPHQAQLEDCGGSIIGSRWILTAAHCPPRPYVRVGSNKRDSGQKYFVKRVISHPKYVPRFSSDIALWELRRKLKFGKKIKPIELGTEDDIKTGAMAVVTGWGHTSFGGEKPKILRQVKVPIVDQDRCNNMYENRMRPIDETMVCAGFEEGGKDACQGDSGGPMSIDNKLIGVVSWGKGCADSQYPGVYARVPLFRKWIKEHTGI